MGINNHALEFKRVSDNSNKKVCAEGFTENEARVACRNFAARYGYDIHLGIYFLKIFVKKKIIKNCK